MKLRKRDAACSEGTPTNEFTSRRAYSLKEAFAPGTTSRVVCFQMYFSSALPHHAVPWQKMENIHLSMQYTTFLATKIPQVRVRRFTTLKWSVFYYLD